MMSRDVTEQMYRANDTATIEPYTRHERREEGPPRRSSALSTICSRDGRVTATVYGGCPAYVLVRYENVTEGAIETALLDMPADLPPLCCLVVLSREWQI